MKSSCNDVYYEKYLKICILFAHTFLSLMFVTYFNFNAFTELFHKWIKSMCIPLTTVVKINGWKRNGFD